MKIGTQPIIDTKTAPAWFYPGVCCYVCPRNALRRWKVHNSKTRKQKKQRMPTVFYSA